MSQNGHYMSLYGEKHTQEGEYHVHELSSRCVLAISKGYTVPFVSKTDPNEDAVFAFEGSNFSCLAVADAHWGKTSSHLAISTLERHCRQWEKAPSPKEVIDVFLEVERLCAQSGSDSETSFLIALIQGDKEQLHLFHSGDAVAILFHNGSAQKVSEDTHLWLGPRTYRRRPYARQEEVLRSLGPWHRQLPFPKGSLLLVCSDGLTEPIYGVESFFPHQMHTLWQEHYSVSSFAHTLMSEALRRDRSYGGQNHRGGEDNISLAMYHNLDE